MASARGKNKLSETEASIRSQSIRSGVQYNTFFHFQQGENYSGILHATFQLTDNTNLFLDFSGSSISDLRVNGHKIENPDSHFKEARIHIPTEHIRVGYPNTVSVKFHNEYFHDGNGIHSFTDTDGKQYLYTQSEPFFGNRVMPIFDQPDLKANITYHVASPADWEVITSTDADTKLAKYSELAGVERCAFQNLILELYPADKLDGHSYRRFNQAIALSTYLFNVVCGPYFRIDLDAEKRYRNIPMAIYCRDSLAEFAKNEAHNIFEFNKHGIRRYEELFSVNYPFGKCDTLFCPEFTVGAMEYPGAITYTERLLPREQPNTVNMVSLRGSVILHELAHMWFGNLVTMKWWDDLWLNESFADFVCYQAWADIVPALDFETYDAWLQFMTRKGWGYKEDQESTTHPIAGSVVNTEAAETIFDGITYSKGAATMRQICSLVGTERFFKALGKYFRRFQYRNTVLDDLITALQEELNSGDQSNQHPAFNLANWKSSWLSTSGLNTVQVEWAKGKGQQTIKLHQGAAMEAHPTLRFHRINLGFFTADGKLAEEKEIILEDKAITEVNVDVKDYVAIIPNHRDYSFIKILLDTESAEFFKTHFKHLEDPLTKGLILRAFYDGVRDARVKATDFLELCLSVIENEKSIQVLDIMYGFVSAALGIIREKNLDNYYSKLFKLTKAKTLTYTHPATVRSMLQKLLNFARVKEDVEYLQQWLEGTNADLKEHSLAIGDKWAIVFKLHGIGADPEVVKGLLDKLNEEDQSETKKSFHLKINALTASDEERQKLFDQYFDANSPFSYKDLESSLAGFSSHYVPEAKRRVFFEKFFPKVGEFMRNSTKEVARTLYYGLLPIVDDHEYKLLHLSEISKTIKDDEIFLKKAVNQTIEEHIRLKKARELDSSA